MQRLYDCYMIVCHNQWGVNGEYFRFSQWNFKSVYRNLSLKTAVLPQPIFLSSNATLFYGIFFIDLKVNSPTKWDTDPSYCNAKYVLTIYTVYILYLETCFFLMKTAIFVIFWNKCCIYTQVFDTYCYIWGNHTRTFMLGFYMCFTYISIHNFSVWVSKW